MADTDLEPTPEAPIEEPGLDGAPEADVAPDPGSGQAPGAQARPNAAPMAMIPSPLSELVEQARRETAALDTELREIEMLIGQARAEAQRHETRRSQASDKIASYAGRSGADPKELADLNAQLVTLTQRATLMAAQGDVLEGKLKALTRYRDAAAGYAEALAELGEAGVGGPAAEASAASSGDGSTGPSVSRAVLAAQEDMRREIAREMHDGPAQSLTNIILQAQIVERLLDRDPAQARRETLTLNEMVQRSLDATKTFIFDVRPMVLDDLGLVPTLRRLARERSRRSHVPVSFESQGADRRLASDVESAVFRIIDEAMTAYAEAHPDEILVTLDWADGFEALVSAPRDEEPTDETTDAEPAAVKRPRLRIGRGKPKEEAPPAALAAMMEDRKADEEAAREAARIRLPDVAWTSIQARAASAGVTVALEDDGAALRLTLGEAAP